MTSRVKMFRTGAYQDVDTVTTVADGSRRPAGSMIARGVT